MKILWLIPFISALIGWVTNYLAVKMIFRPKKEISILGVKVQGLIPKRQKDLAVKIGETVESELISHDDIKSAVNTPEFQKDVLEKIMDAIDKFIVEKLGSNPLIAMFLSGDSASQIKGVVRSELGGVVPQMMEEMFEEMEERVDFRAIVSNKIEGFDLSKLEDIIYKIASSELKAIEILGGVLGFVVGCFQVVLLTVF